MLQAPIHNNQELSQLIQQTNLQKEAIAHHNQHPQAIRDRCLPLIGLKYNQQKFTLNYATTGGNLASDR